MYCPTDCRWWSVYLDELDGQGALPHSSTSNHHQFEPLLLPAHCFRPGPELFPSDAVGRQRRNFSTNSPFTVKVRRGLLGDRFHFTTRSSFSPGGLQRAESRSPAGAPVSVHRRKNTTAVRQWKWNGCNPTLVSFTFFFHRFVFFSSSLFFVFFSASGRNCFPFPQKTKNN